MVFDIGCLSPTLDHVDERFNTPILINLRVFGWTYFLVGARRPNL